MSSDTAPPLDASSLGAGPRRLAGRVGDRRQVDGVFCNPVHYTWGSRFGRKPQDKGATRSLMPPAVDFAGGLARLARLQALRCRSDLDGPLSPSFDFSLAASSLASFLGLCPPAAYSHCVCCVCACLADTPAYRGFSPPPVWAGHLLPDCHFVYFGIHYAKTIKNRFDSRSAYNASSKPMKSVFNLRVRFMKELQDMLRRVKFSTVRQWIYCKTEMTIFAKLTVS